MVKNDSQSTINLGDAPEVLDLVANSIIGLWDVVNNLTRLLRDCERGGAAAVLRRHVHT
jgi:hypothetical protein